MPDKKSNSLHSTPRDQDRIQKVRQFYTSTHALEENWENSAYIYSWRNPVGFYMRQKVRHYLIEMLNKHSLFLAEKRILDIGCGYGDWLRFFAEIRGNSQGLVGVDITASRILKAKAINPGIDFVIADARSLLFANSSFDIVMQFDCFEHFLDDADLEKAARELTRVLKNHGLLIWFELLPFSPKSHLDLIRGFSLNEVMSLFPEFELIAYKPMFKKLNFGFRTISTVYQLPRFSLMLTDLAQRIPGKNNNLLLLMMKNA